MRILSAFLSFALLITCGLAADSDDAPRSINGHYRWCGEAKKAAEKLKRYEGFWQERHPAKDDEYDDSPHVYYVRRCAYRLVELYAQTGQKEKSLKMLKWLEDHDDSFPDNQDAKAPAK